MGHIFTVLNSTKQILNYSEVKEVLSTYPGSKISFHVGNNHNNQGCYWNVSPEHLYSQFYLCHKYLPFIDAALLKNTLQNYRVNIFCDLTLATLSLFPLDDYVPSILTLLKLQNEA